ncbi:hypothetical protein D3C77_703520 [compost metagenome]
MQTDVFPQAEDPPQGFLVIWHLCVQAMPVAVGQRLQTLLNAEWGFAKQPG